jgi:PAS domain S-box-containing protein
MLLVKLPPIREASMRDEDKTKEQLVNELVELRQRVSELSAAEAERKQAEEKEKQYIRELEFLSKSIAEFVELPRGRDIYWFIGEKLQELVGGSVVSINSFDEVSSSLCIRAILGLGERTKAVMRIMDGDLVGRSFRIDDEAKRGLLNARLTKVPKGVHGLSPGIPKAVSRAIERLFGLGDVYAMGFSWERELFGSITILTRKGDELKDLGLVETFVRQASVLLQRSKAEEALERRATQLALINDIGGKIAAVLELDEVLDRAARLVQESLGYHHVALFTLDHEQGELVMRAKAGTFTDLFPPDHRLKLGQGIVGWVGRHGQTLLADDVEAEPRYANLYSGMIPTRSELSVPIRVGEEVLGVLDAQSSQLGAFDENDVMMMETLADQLAVAIENARLYQETMRRLKEAETFSAVTTTLTRSLDLDQVLQAIMGFAPRLIPASIGGVTHLVDEATGKLIPEAASVFQVNTQNGVGMSIGQGIAGLVVQEKRLIDVPNVEQAPRFLAADTPIKSLLAAPLLIDGDCIGTLSLNSHQVGAFSADDERLLTTLAAQAAIAVRNARLHQEVRRRVEELTFLNQAGRTVTSNLDLEQVLTTVMGETGRALKAEAGSILLIDEESSELTFGTAVGPHSEKVRGLRLPLGQGIAGWVAREGQPLLVPDVRENPRFYPGVDEATGFVTRSILAAPLKVRGKVIGVIEAVNRIEGDFGQADVALLSSLAQWAAIAIENAQLFAETRRRYEEMAALHDTLLGITARLEMPELLRSIIERAVTLLRADAGGVYLYNSEREELKLTVGYGYTEKYVGVTLELREGAAGKVFQTGEPLIVDDYRNWEERAAVFEDDQSLSTVLEVPLKWQKQVIGVLAINADAQRRTFNQEDIWLATLFANQAAIALENARLYEDIRQERDYSQTLITTANALVVGLDLEGHVILCNNFCEKITGYSREEALGQDWFTTFLPKRKHSLTKRVFRELVGQGLISQHENPILTKDGRERAIAWSNTVIHDAEGRPMSVLAIGQDITERKQAEKALKEERALLAQRVAERTAELSIANAELARAARLKDEFLASMSHELRTPLNAILGMSEALQEQVYGPLNEKQLRSLHTIEGSGRHLLSLINDILDVSKIEAGKLELEVGPVSVQSVCQASLGLIKQTAYKKRLEVSFTFDNAVTTLQADERRLKQILVNLLSNAVKFTPGGGAIGLEVAGDAKGEAAHLIVWDTGIGISKEDMGRLFQPFVQLDSSLSRQHTGTGLGLSLVYRLTEMHGGSVSVESEVGKGSRFTVSLPWQVAEKVERSEESVEGKGKGAPRVTLPMPNIPLLLLAEDNEGSINTLTDYLGAKGYRVVVGRDGAEAIERAREERPDLILMDIQMPGMDGLEATRRIRADADPSTGLRTSLAKVPIIALTALAMPGDRERCLAAGANDYLSKPVSLKKLVEVIEAQLA